MQWHHIHSQKGVEGYTVAWHQSATVTQVELLQMATEIYRKSMSHSERWTFFQLYIDHHYISRNCKVFFLYLCMKIIPHTHTHAHRCRVDACNALVTGIETATFVLHLAMHTLFYFSTWCKQACLFMQTSMSNLNSPSRVVKDSTPFRRQILRCINFETGEYSPSLFLDVVNLYLIKFREQRIFNERMFYSFITFFIWKWILT